MTTTTTTSIEKICECREDRWVRCAHPWYMKKFRWQGKAYRPNLTRYAREILHERLTTKTRADQIGEAVRAAILAGTFLSAKANRRPVPGVDWRAVAAQCQRGGVTFRAAVVALERAWTTDTTTTTTTTEGDARR